MHLNTLKPAEGSKKNRKRVGRGIGSGTGKTCGRGHKGQKSRSGGKVQVGFEGGQMPLQRRLPKVGFRSRKALTRANIRTGTLETFSESEVTLQSLKDAGLVKKNTLAVKVYLAGELSKALTIKGLLVSKGAQAAIEKAGGKVEV